MARLSGQDSSKRRRRSISVDEKLLRERLKKSGGKSLVDDVGEDECERADLEFNDTHSSQGIVVSVSGCLRAIKFVVRLFGWGFLLIAVGILVSMHIWGQSNVTLAGLMYVPPAIWLIPALLLFPIALALDWKLASGLFLSMVAFLIWHIDYQIRPTPEITDQKGIYTIRMLTWNRGQSKGASLSKLKKGLEIDLIFLQDDKFAHYQNNPDYAELPHTQSVGEFVVLSRWPILSMTPIYPQLGSSSGNSRAWGVRCVLTAAGRRCVVYNLHLPTPRGALESYMRGSFLWGIIGQLPVGHWAQKKEVYESFWRPYLAFAENFKLRLSEEIGPVLVVGDFNTPPFGPVHRGLTHELEDCHLISGSGFGFTFPGQTRNPLALFQSWLRLDRVHASDHWQSIKCMPLEMPAQHLPVFAELNLPPLDNFSTDAVFKDLDGTKP